jgi:hypothetical protein
VRSICETLRTYATDPWEQTSLPIAIILCGDQALRGLEGIVEEINGVSEGC